MGEDTVQVHTGHRQLGRIQCKYFHFFSLSLFFFFYSHWVDLQGQDKFIFPVFLGEVPPGPRLACL